MDFYYMSDSPPCGAVLLVANALGVKLNRKHLNWSQNDTMKPDFLAINPEHIVPTIVDGDLTLWESRAIITYLSTKYGNNKFYSKVPEVRALIDKKLYFDATNLYSKFLSYVMPPIMEGTPFNANRLKEIHDALLLFENSFVTNTFSVGDQITLADHSLVASVASMKECGIKMNDYPKILQWMTRCKSEMPGFEELTEGAKELEEMLKTIIKEKKIVTL